MGSTPISGTRAGRSVWVLVSRHTPITQPTFYPPFTHCLQEIKMETLLLILFIVIVVGVLWMQYGNQ